MKKRSDFRECFGEPDQAFIDRIHVTLASLPQEEEVQVKKGYHMIALVAALMALMTFALAEANFLGIKDFMRLWLGGDSSSLEQVISVTAQRDIVLSGAEMEEAELAIREVLYDGNNLYIVTQLMPRDEKTLFVNMYDDEWGCPMGFMEENGEIVETGLTVEEYAQRNGYERVVCAGVSVRIPDTDHRIDEKINIRGGVIEMMAVSGLGGAEVVPAKLTVTLRDLSVQDAQESILERVEVELEIHKTEVEDELYVSRASVDCAALGVRVDGVTIRRTPLGAYTMTEWSITDAETYQKTVDHGLWTDFLDENGEAYLCLMRERETISDTRYRETEMIPLLKGDLSSVTLRIYGINGISAICEIPMERKN